MTNLELNAHIERLIDSAGHDSESREVLAGMAGEIPREQIFESHIEASNPGAKMTGVTDLGADMTVNTTETWSATIGGRHLRIGYYKLRRHGRDIEIEHFWKSEMGTESDTEMSQQWCLALDRSGRPVWFGERARAELFSLKILPRVVLSVCRDYFVESWGEKPGMRHPSIFHINLVVV